MAYAFNDDKSKFDLEETIDNVDSLIGNMAVIETSPVITNHSAGEYIMYNGTLLKVLSPIATGENLVLGTNVTPINFGNEIKALQDSTLFRDLAMTSNFNTGFTLQESTCFRCHNIVIWHFVINCSAGVASGTRANVGTITIDNNSNPRNGRGTVNLAANAMADIGGVAVATVPMCFLTDGKIAIDNYTGRTLKQFRGNAVWFC